MYSVCYSLERFQKYKVQKFNIQQAVTRASNYQILFRPCLSRPLHVCERDPGTMNLLYTPVYIHMYLDYSQVYNLKKGAQHTAILCMLINRQ